MEITATGATTPKDIPTRASAAGFFLGEAESFKKRIDKVNEEFKRRQKIAGYGHNIRMDDIEDIELMGDEKYAKRAALFSRLGEGIKNGDEAVVIEAKHYLQSEITIVDGRDAQIRKELGGKLPGDSRFEYGQKTVVLLGRDVKGATNISEEGRGALRDALQHAQEDLRSTERFRLQRELNGISASRIAMTRALSGLR